MKKDIQEMYDDEMSENYDYTSPLIDEINMQVEKIDEKIKLINEIEERIDNKVESIYGNIISLMSIFVSIGAFLFLSIQAVDRMFPDGPIIFIRLVEYASFLCALLIIFNFSLMYLVKTMFFRRRSDTQQYSKNDLTIKNFLIDLKKIIFEYKLSFISVLFLTLVSVGAFLINNHQYFSDLIRKELFYIILSLIIIITLNLSLYKTYINKTKKMISSIGIEKEGD